MRYHFEAMSIFLFCLLVDFMPISLFVRGIVLFDTILIIKCYVLTFILVLCREKFKIWVANKILFNPNQTLNFFFFFHLCKQKISSWVPVFQCMFSPHKGILKVIEICSLQLYSEEYISLCIIYDHFTKKAL